MDGRHRGGTAAAHLADCCCWQVHFCKDPRIKPKAGRLQKRLWRGPTGTGPHLRRHIEKYAAELRICPRVCLRGAGGYHHHRSRAGTVYCHRRSSGRLFPGGYQSGHRDDHRHPQKFNIRLRQKFDGRRSLYHLRPAHHHDLLCRKGRA